MRDWNTTALQKAGHSAEEAAALAAGMSPNRDLIAAAQRGAEAGAALLFRPEPAGDAGLVQIHAAAGRFFLACVTGSWVPDYLSDRGLAAALLPSSPWKIGYAPATWTALTDHLRGQGYTDTVMLQSGLVTTGRDGRIHDRFRDRLMVPLRNETGHAIAFIGRRHPGTHDEDTPKYLNSPDTDAFTKGQVLAGLAEGRRFLANGAQPVLVEGPMDALAVSIAAPGMFTGIAPCGTSLTAAQVAVLSRGTDLPGRGIRVALDADPAGRKAAIRDYSLLQPATAGITAVILPDGNDPADILKTDGRDALREILTTSTCPLADLVIDARLDEWAHGRELTFTELQIGALRAAAKAIATMPSSEVGPQAARLGALFTRRYGWHPEEVTGEVIEAVERHYTTASMSELPGAVSDLVSAARAPASEIPAPRRNRLDEDPYRAQAVLHDEAERG